MNNNTIILKNRPLQSFCAGAEFSYFDKLLANLSIFTTEMAVKITIKIEIARLCAKFTPLGTVIFE